MTPGPQEPNGTMDLVLGNRRVTVPLIVDEDTTQRIADSVNRRLQEIEADSDRVDTQVFALKAALYIAADLDELRQDRAEETKQLVKALDAIANALRTLAEELGTAEDE